MTHRLAVIALAVLAGLPTRSARAAPDPSTWTRDQVVTAVAQGTGMTKDAVGLALGDSPKSLEKATEILTGVQIISQIADARDDDAAATAVDWALGKVKDKLVTGPAATALTAVSLYKTTLELVHDHAYMPAMDDRIYEAYRSQRLADARGGQLNPSAESSDTAFSTATTRSGSGYQVVKDRVYQEMLKRRNIKASDVGPRLEGWLRSQIDVYWQARMESRLQRQWMKENKDRLLDQAWGTAKADMAAAKPTLPKGLAEDPDVTAALAAWKADYEKDVAASSGDKGYYKYTQKLEWVTPPYVKDGAVVGRHRIHATYVYYAGEHKGRTVDQTVNEYYVGNPIPGQYTTVSQILAKYGSKKGQGGK